MKIVFLEKIVPARCLLDRLQRCGVYRNHVFSADVSDIFEYDRTRVCDAVAELGYIL